MVVFFNEKILTLNPENVPETEVLNYKTREAVRAVVFDQDNKIVLLHVLSKGYYKLPVGGIDEGEDILQALKRECLEETGCRIELGKEIGKVTELRRIFQLKQLSFCYTAKVLGEKGSPYFTESELLDGFEIIWATISEAIQLMKNSKTTDTEGLLYIVPRDLKILEEISS